MKFLIIVIFVLLNFLIFYTTEINVKQRSDASLKTHLHNLQVNYEIFMTMQAEIADNVFESSINTKKIKNILKEAYFENSITNQNTLREKLQETLSDKYEKLHYNSGVLQVHFVFPNNKTFLRMHKPSKYGDDLSRVRADVVNVNKNHLVVRGFSQGKTAHAFRNIYPIFDEKKYLGAVEISYPSEVLQKNLNKISEIYSHFIVKKSIFKTNAWQRDDVLLQYTDSIVHKDYLHTKTRLDDRFMKKYNLDTRLLELKNEIDKEIVKDKMFSLSSEYKNKLMIISFIPIYQNFTNEVSAWIVSFETDKFMTSTLKFTNVVRIAGFILVLVLMFFLYRILAQQKKHNKLLSLYDKNVIFSSTDTKGIITHVSEAFCEISGYEADDLVGKPHNIVRHKDMPKEVFKEMWDTIKKGGTWSGEVKNARRDGSFYWVQAEIEPQYDDKKITGYSALRHDITDRKEIEFIQKDIIFTMGAIGENRSLETGNHVKRVALYSKVFAKHYGLSKDEIERLYQASPMHDIGKIAIPDAILNKPGKLNDQEMKVMQTHAQKGYEMLSISTRPLLQAAAIVAHHHHEKWDGSGYPRGLIGTEIDIFGRITAIADVFDALGSDRCYKKAWPDEKIFTLLKDESGKHFEPKLVEIFFENLDEFLAIRDSLK